MNIIDWRDALLESSLNYKAKFVGLILSQFYRSTKPTYPSIRTLSRLSGLTINPVQDGIFCLIQEGFLGRSKQRMAGDKYLSNIYTFNGVTAEISHILTVSPGDTSYDTSYDTSPGDTEEDKEDKEDKGYSVQSQMIEIWNEITQPKFSSVKVSMTEKRKKRLKILSSRFNMEEWTDYCKKIANTNFLYGENERKWKAGFDWVLKEDNLIKILEGNYDKKIQTSLPYSKETFYFRNGELTND